ncbi:MAG: hypothetical protein HY286_10885 [Planctomycetes bacterium]|nr:hypothetical protein [Planctomycetota bacterium]
MIQHTHRAARPRAKAFVNFLLFSILSSVVVGGALRATVVERKNLPDLVKASARIVEGKVTKTEACYDRMGGIATSVTIEVSHGIRGAKDAEKIEFKIIGGELGGRGLIVAGFPKFQVQDEMLLFLTEETVRGICVPVGLGQGKFNIQRDPKTGAKRISRDLAGLETIDPATGRTVSLGESAQFDYDTTIKNIEKLVLDDDAARELKKTDDGKKNAGGAASRGVK